MNQDATNQELAELLELFDHARGIFPRPKPAPKAGRVHIFKPQPKQEKETKPLTKGNL